MRVLKIAGAAVVALALAALAVVYAPEVAGQARVRTPKARTLDVFGRGMHIGVSVRDVDETDAKREKTATSGVVIDEVFTDTPASRAGLKAGDVVVEYDGERVRSARQFARLVNETPEGHPVKLTAIRDGQRVAVDIVPETRGRGNAWLSGEVFDRLELDMPEIKMAVPEFELRTFGTTGRLGVRIQTLTPQLATYFGATRGALVTEVDEGSAAGKAGIKAGDVITSIDGRTVEDAGDLQRALRGTEEGAEVSIEILRDRKPMTIKAKPESPYERRSARRRITDI
ncbi:MAG TPA: PDZ domain-containing protein [Vicinamibacterales bacterium]|jgi:serine protease Do|nr:PDZ domain-containing protein [Vicinamibacterales bacterium]